MSDDMSGTEQAGGDLFVLKQGDDYYAIPAAVLEELKVPREHHDEVEAALRAEDDVSGFLFQPLAPTTGTGTWYKGPTWGTPAPWVPKPPTNWPH